MATTRTDGRADRVAKWLSEIQHNARLLGHAALVPGGAWEIAIGVSVHIDNLPRKIETAYAVADSLPEAGRTHYEKALRRMYRGWQLVSRAISDHRTKPASARKLLRVGALELYSGAGDAYSLIVHHRYRGWGGVEGYLATRHEFKRSLRRRRREVSRSLATWPAHIESRAGSRARGR
jgi:hypothetical protein